jgi:hypothetical protein
VHLDRAPGEEQRFGDLAVAQAVGEVERYCQDQVPADARSEIRIEYSVRGSAITIVERRPPWSELAERSTGVAQLRYDGGLWTLWASDRCSPRSTRTRPGSSGADDASPWPTHRRRAGAASRSYGHC